MRNASRVSKALKKLSADPQLLQVITTARRRFPKKGSNRIESLADLYVLLAQVAALFSNKKRARAIDQHVDLVRLLVRVSLLLKENLLDRPEVRQFFGRSKPPAPATRNERDTPRRKRPRTRPAAARSGRGSRAIESAGPPVARR